MPSRREERIFISYSHRDRKYLEDLKTILTPTMRDGPIFISDVPIWDDTKITPGLEWREEIDKALSSATIALLLVSNHYLASKFIVEEELIPILDRVKKGGLRVFWLLVNPCLVKGTGISKYQAIDPVNADEPLSKLPANKRQEKLVRICERIVEMIKVEEIKEPPSLINGWYPYTYKDKDIFAELQRQAFVEACVSGICHEDFRFGLLQGESGVGKTSALQAGLGPRLKELV